MSSPLIQLRRLDCAKRPFAQGKAFCLLTGILLLFSVSGCQNGEEADTNAAPITELSSDKYLLERVVSAESSEVIVKFCGDCHAMPNPQNFPIEGWRQEVKRGFEFYDQSGRFDLKRPNFHDTVAYFTQKAPPRDEFLRRLEALETNDQFKGIFKLIEYPQIRKVNAVSDIEFTDRGRRGFIASDMREGNIYFHPFEKPEAAELLANCEAPVNLNPCDLDQDGIADILISDIGVVQATDAKKGELIWLKGTANGYEKISLAGNLGRICQTVVADFDGDKRNDILVAEFGYFKTGSTYILMNDGSGFGPKNFSVSEIDSRHGTSRIAPIDLDGDGDLDFVAAIAQEHETIQAYLNDGQGKFRAQPLYEAEFPSYGTSGISLVDLDADGDQDILYTNGDTFDSMLPKPYHSIQWLENQGELKFKHHHVAHMPGVNAARAADFDGDGDLDIIACAFMPGLEEAIKFDALVFLENDGRFQFKKYWIEKNQGYYPELKLGDFDQDGRMDFAVGTCIIGKNPDNIMPLRIYLNRGNTGNSSFP